MKTTSIKFTATFWDDQARMQRREPVEFKLGEGPCGKTVDELILDFDHGCINICQVHSDDTAKDFVYRLDHIVGRIEIDRTR